MQINALAVEMPHVQRHPNRKPFRGVLTLVDVPSDRPPAGARGHRVLLTRAAAEAALPSLIGMALDYTPTLDGHDARLKIGVVTGAEIVGRELFIQGHIFARDFPELMAELEAGRGRLGMSYELAEARVDDVSAAIWKLTEAIFTGAAVLRRDKAAYSGTWIATGLNAGSGAMMRAARQQQNKQIKRTGESVAMEINVNGDNNTASSAVASDFVEIAQRMAAAAEALSSSVSWIEAQHEEMAQRIERIVATVEQTEEINLRGRIAELEKTNSELRTKLEAGTSSAGVAYGGRAQSSGRKTLPPLVSALLAKSGVEVTDAMDQDALDATLAPLSIEQRIAVKAQMAKAGLIA